MRAQNKNQVVGILRRNKSEFEKLGVRRVGLFGSFVRDEAKDESDVDLLMEFSKGKKSYKNYINSVFLAEKMLGRKVEVVTPEALSPYIGEDIKKQIEYV